MNKLYTFALVVLSGIALVSCETEGLENDAQESRMAPAIGKQLTIINHSDFNMTAEIYCFGAEDNVAVNSSIRVMGKSMIPANTNVTYKNFAQSSNSACRINPWFVTENSSAPIAYTAIHVNDTYGQLYNLNSPVSKFANWRYMKVELTTNSIPGFTQSVVMSIQLPYYSNNNSGEVFVDLTPYGIQQNLHIMQSSVLDQHGNTVLTLESELVN